MFMYICYYMCVRAQQSEVVTMNIEYGTLLNRNRCGRLGSCLVKVPGLFCIQGSRTLENEAALCKNYGL